MPEDVTYTQFQYIDYRAANKDDKEKYITDIVAAILDVDGKNRLVELCFDKIYNLDPVEFKKFLKKIINDATGISFAVFASRVEVKKPENDLVLSVVFNTIVRMSTR